MAMFSKFFSFNLFSMSVTTLMALSTLSTVPHTLDANNCCTTVCLDDSCTRWCGDCRDIAHLCSAMPKSSCFLFAGGEYLYWTAHQNELDYAHIRGHQNNDNIIIDDNLSCSSSSSSSSHSNSDRDRLKFVDYGNNSGWRAFAGLKFGCDAWAIKLVWTEINIDGSSECDDDFIHPVLLHPYNTIINIEDFNHAEAHVGLDYKTLDFLLEHPMGMTSTFILNPFFGFRCLDLHQKFDVTYSGLIRHHDIDWHSKYKGYGMYAGTGWSVCLGECVGCGIASINGHFGGIVTVGDVDTSLRHTLHNVTMIDVVDDNTWISVPGISLGADFAWETCICGNFFQCNVGYEFNQYFGLPQPRRYINNSEEERAERHACGSSHSNILVHGLTAKMEFHF